MSVQLRALPAARPTERARVADNATLAARDEVTATLALFVVELDQPLADFRPGQYVSVGVITPDGLVQRPYSIVSLDGARRRVELLIRRLPHGRLSNLLWALPDGARLRVGQARGLFVLDEADTRPRLMIGSGTGLAPLLAMLDGAFARRDTTPTVLIHGVSFHAELACAARLAGWRSAGLPLDYRPTVSRPHETRNALWRGLTGRAEDQLAALLDDQPRLANAKAYLCGNPEMIEAARRVLVTAGMVPADIRSEQFHAPVPPRAA